MNEYLIAFYGWLFFNLILLGLAKDKDDDKKRRFDVTLWWSFYWDNILITFFGIPVVVFFSNDIWVIIVNNWFGKDWGYNKFSLMLDVPFVQFC